MALVPVGLQIEYFADPTKFGAVAGGSVYVGEPDLDPEILANRITVTLRQEDGVDVPIAPSEQPFTTGSGGVILYNGSPASLLADQAYSLKVLNSGLSQVYYVAESTGAGTVGIDDGATTAQVILRDAYMQILNDVGINTVPNIAWGANIGSLQMGYSGAVWANNPASDNAIALGANHYNNGVSDKYMNTMVASQYEQKDGIHNFKTAISGAQDNDISWIETLSIANDGSLTIGTPIGGALGLGTVNTPGGYYVDGQEILPGLSQGALFGMILSNNATDPNNDIDISIGRCRSSDNLRDIDLTSVIIKQLDIAWAQGTGQGGLFSGSKAADTWYHVFAIRNDTTGVADVGFSTDINAGDRPGGWTQYRRLGSILTDGTLNIRGFTQVGDEFVWSSAVIDFNVSDPGTTYVYRVVAVPLDVVTVARMAIGMLYTASSIFESDWQSPLRGEEISYNAAVMAYHNVAGSQYSQYGRHYVTLQTNTSSQIRTKSNSTSASLSIQGAVLSYKDFRGVWE